MRSSSGSGQQKYAFPIKCVLFLALLLLVGKGINELFIKLVLSESYLYRTETQFEAQKQDIRILAVGDSHPKFAINPDYLPHSFIISSKRENVIQIYYRLLRYLQVEHLDLQLVILPLDVHTFAPIGDDELAPHDFWRKYLDYRELGQSRGKLKKFIKYRASGEVSFAGGVDNTILLMKIWVGLRAEPDKLISGYQVRQGNFAEFLDPVYDAEIKAEAHIVGDNHIDPETERYFLASLALLQSQGIDFVFIKYPVPWEYYQEVNKLMDVPGYYEKVTATLHEQYPGALVLDYQDIFFDSPQYFSDSDHLNAAGAVVFTQILRQDLLTQHLIPAEN